jgi:hypothetical protein
MPNNLPGSEQLPSPDDRRRALEWAFKNSKWANDAFANTILTDVQKAQKRLEDATLKIYKVGEEVKTRSIALGLPYDEAAMGKLIMDGFMDFTQYESKEALRSMLSTVCTGMMLEAVKEL